MGAKEKKSWNTCYTNSPTWEYFTHPLILKNLLNTFSNSLKYSW